MPPQGPPREFGGQIFDKTAIRYRKLRMAAKTFALPDVAVGSIIDYRYKDRDRLCGYRFDQGLEDIADRARLGRPAGGGRIRPADRAAGPCPSRAGTSRRSCSRKRPSSASSRSNVRLISRLFGRSGCKVSWVSIGKMSGKPDDRMSAGHSGARRHPALRGGGLFRSRGDAPDVGRLLLRQRRGSRTATSSGSSRARTGRRASTDFLGKPGKHGAAARDGRRRRDRSAGEAQDGSTPGSKDSAISATRRA